MQGLIILNDTGMREPSPPWDIEDNVDGSSTVMAGPSEPLGDGLGESAPPLAQMNSACLAAVEAGTPETGDQPTDDPIRKSTPSTLSDDADDTAVSEVGLVKRQGRANTRKRPISKGADSEDREMSEEGHDSRRRSRKSARLA